jgi:co-chaperonin GroES (HSP10)
VTYEEALNIYTDGSSFQRPRRGGVGIRYIIINYAGDEVAIDGEVLLILSGREILGILR